ERHTEQQEHHPYLVLNRELIPPLCGPSIHRVISFLLGSLLKSLWPLFNLCFRRKKCQEPGDPKPKTGPHNTRDGSVSQVAGSLLFRFWVTQTNRDESDRTSDDALYSRSILPSFNLT